MADEKTLPTPTAVPAAVTSSRPNPSPGAPRSTPVPGSTARMAPVNTSRPPSAPMTNGVPPGVPTVPTRPAVPRAEAPRAPGAPAARGPAAPASARNGGPSSLPPEELKQFAELEKRPKLSETMDPELDQAVGFTHFDSSGSHDNLVTVLTTRDDLLQLSSQSLVRVKSRDSESTTRIYLGVVVKGPFSEPDAIAASSTMAVSTVLQGKKLSYTFDYHGRTEVEILGEVVDGKLLPAGRRPRPKSPVFLLDENESAKVLGMSGDLCLGLVSGYRAMEARLDPEDKSILPRHTGIIGTTGGGKSTTVATLIHRAQAAGIATIVFDVEGEYTHVNKPTTQAAMLEALKRRGQKAEGVKDLHVHHLTGRETLNPDHEELHEFSLKFSSLSPYAIAEILNLSEAQQERFHKAYDVTKLLLEDFEIFPRYRNDEDRQALLDLDELTTGYPQMTLQHLLDVVSAYLYSLGDEAKSESRSRGRSTTRKKGASEESDEGSDAENEDLPKGPRLFSEFGRNVGRVMSRVHAQSSKNEISWKALAGKLYQLRRLKIFDVDSVPGVNHESMLTRGRVSVIDLSDTDSPQLNNLVIADILRGLQEAQETRYQNGTFTPVLIILEEAHEFLSASRITQMPVLFDQVARIAKRGRKRWLGLVFVTQLPQHLPNEVLGLINNFIIHKITDSSVITRMQRTVGSIDESLWDRVPRLAPGQAIVSFSNFTRPLMVAIDPAPVMRQLVD